MRSRIHIPFKLRTFSIATVIIFMLSGTPQFAYSAQKIVPGSPCKTFNSIAVANQKTYTCVKKGGKLIWNSGVAIKKASPATSVTPSPNPKPSASPSTYVEILSKDSRITSATLLSAVSECKTIDKTPEMRSFGSLSRNGFPRPKDAVYPSAKAKILVIPFQYQNWPFTTTVPKGSNRTMSDLDMLKNVNKQVAELFKELSAGKFEVEFTVLPEDQWWVMDPDQQFDPTPMKENFGPVKQMINKYDGKIDFEKYDSYVFVSSLYAPQMPVATAEFVTDLKTSKGNAKKLVLMTYRWTSPNIYFHELGHSMFAFEDLYLQMDSPATWIPQDMKVILMWDLMANAELSSLTNWNRLLMGWVSDSQVRCVTNQNETIHYLSDFTKSSEPNLLLINLEPGVTLAAEPRIWGETQRLLLYLVDTNLNHGQGPLRSYDTLLKVGDHKEIFNWQFKVLETSKEGILVQTSKTSGSKYVAPTQSQANQGGGDRPRPRVGEIVATGYLQARATWEISNYKSYRIFITPFDEPNRILFDTGIVNDSRDPLVVEVSGLICGKEFMTTSQFWVERDGKGNKDQSSSGQLRMFECKS